MKFDDASLPQHVAIIMDGNGRWAKQRKLPRVAGHRKGVETLKEIVRYANHCGIKVLTVYAFSTENWGRPKDEVNYLMNLPKTFFNEYLDELDKENVKIMTIGDIKSLPEHTHEMMKTSFERTKNNTGLIFNIALNYGSRQEITRAMQLIAKEIEQGELSVDDITPELIDTMLETSELGELASPDLMIRTSGEYRLSNFLLWQLAYSEFYFTPTYWPDFTPEHFDQALIDYMHRQRRYGKL